jgi:hypothetical protein
MNRGYENQEVGTDDIDTEMKWAGYALAAPMAS